jgi:hypothetical protein
VDVLDKTPTNLEGSEPLAGFPPIFERFIVIDVRGHLGNTQELIAANDTRG